MAVSSLNKSTTVRLKLSMLRTTFAALERTAPGLGARWAERLWFTLPPAPRSAGLSGGTPFEVLSRGRLVRGQVWGSGPTVYLVHGWGGHAGQFAAFVEPLVAAGYRVVAHDGPSHGSSDPGRWGSGSSDVLELGYALDAVVANHGPAYAVVGHSMGALVTALALRHGWVGAERLVMIAPMTDAASVVPIFAGQFGIGPEVVRRLVGRVERRLAMPFGAFDLATIAPEIDRPRSLAIHDRYDADTDLAVTETALGAWPGAELVVTEGLGHRRILRDADVVRRVLAFLGDDALAWGSPAPNRLALGTPVPKSA